jgi:hypothetical protein
VPTENKPTLSTATASKEWLQHGYFRTYTLAAIVEDIARNPFAYLRQELQEFLDHEHITSYVKPFQLYSALHRFAEYVTGHVFYNDLTGPTYYQLSLGDYQPRWVLPVDAAMAAYGIEAEPFFPQFAVSEDSTIMAPMRNGGIAAVAATEDQIADAYYDYFIDLRMSQPYDDLLYRISEEIFYVLFQNRATLGELHSFLAGRVEWLGDDLEDDDQLRTYFATSGRLKRGRIPVWAKRAIFFRDHGKCVYCGRDLSGLLDGLPLEHSDHIVPLARGGLNDVSNLQLVCRKHNLKKSTSTVPASSYYRRWYQAEKADNRRGWREDIESV